MLLFLGIDSQFTMVEVIVTTIEDEFNYHFRKYVKRQEYLVMIVCALTFFVGVIYYTEGGIYFFTLVDYFAAGVSLMYIAFFEVIAVVWFYGGNRLSENIKEMTGKKAHLFFIVCWYGISPTFIVVREFDDRINQCKILRYMLDRIKGMSIYIADKFVKFINLIIDDLD
ncbi:unnamed protein product [Rotaria magnacalcarata]|uniref:Uncharacterized protein n=1 Tax=Rotaria magnacalcarata TaxID=392030 RepID=A0A8S3I488_9BILA|nr:unnamed protein product [Rotaria magnacalcarata]CAF5190052.1 unnamed protein product [Rotaria magnacalcarata]